MDKANLPTNLRNVLSVLENSGIKLLQDFCNEVNMFQVEKNVSNKNVVVFFGKIIDKDVSDSLQLNENAEGINISFCRKNRRTGNSLTTPWTLKFPKVGHVGRLLKTDDEMLTTYKFEVTSNNRVCNFKKESVNFIHGRGL